MYYVHNRCTCKHNRCKQQRKKKIHTINDREKELKCGQDWCGVWLNGRHLLPSWAIDASSDVIIIDFSLQLHWSTCCTQQIMMHFSWSQHSVALRAYYFSVIKSWTSGFGILSFIIFVGHFSLQKKKAVFTSALTKSSDKLPRFEQQTTISQSACTDRIHTTHLDHLFWQFRNIAFFFSSQFPLTKGQVDST